MVYHIYAERPFLWAWYPVNILYLRLLPAEKRRDRCLPGLDCLNNSLMSAPSSVRNTNNPAPKGGVKLNILHKNNKYGGKQKRTTMALRPINSLRNFHMLRGNCVICAIEDFPNVYTELNVNDQRSNCWYYFFWRAPGKLILTNCTNNRLIISYFYHIWNQLLSQTFCRLRQSGVDREWTSWSRPWEACRTSGTVACRGWAVALVLLAPAPWLEIWRVWLDTGVLQDKLTERIHTTYTSLNTSVAYLVSM